MSAMPAIMGRAVYAEIDTPAVGDPLAQAAGWLARLEPWFGPCRSVGVVRREVEGLAVTVVSAGHDADSAVIVHLTSGRPAEIEARVRVEGSKATLEIAADKVRLTTTGTVLDPAGIALPEPDPARASMLDEVLARALASREVETIDD